MARRYDSRTTIFSPEGRLYQVRACDARAVRSAGRARRPCCAPATQTLAMTLRRPCAQVEYAIEAISHAGSAVGILSKDGVVLAAEKKILSKARPAPAPLRAARPPCALPLRVATLRPQTARVRAPPMRRHLLAASPHTRRTRRARRQP